MIIRYSNDDILHDLILKRNQLAFELVHTSDADRMTDRYLALEERMIAVQDEIDWQRNPERFRYPPKFLLA